MRLASFSHVPVLRTLLFKDFAGDAPQHVASHSYVNELLQRQVALDADNERIGADLPAKSGIPIIDFRSDISEDVALGDKIAKHRQINLVQDFVPPFPVVFLVLLQVFQSGSLLQSCTLEDDDMPHVDSSHQ